MDRARAWEILTQYNRNEALLRHAQAVEGCMRRFARLCGEEEELWGVVGLLHDVDYEQYPEQHCAKAQQILAEDWGVSADVWSVTSWTNLRRDGLAAERELLTNPSATPRTPFVAQQLEGATGPIVAVSDYQTDLMDGIRQFVPNEFATLGADGFGFSDTRAGARRFFKIDAESIVVRTLQMLAKRGEVPADAPAKAFAQYDLNNVNAGTSGSAGGDA